MDSIDSCCRLVMRVVPSPALPVYLERQMARLVCRSVGTIVDVEIVKDIQCNRASREMLGDSGRP